MTYRRLLILFLMTMTLESYAQLDTIPGEKEYLKHYNCQYQPGNILMVQKKGKIISDLMPGKPKSEGFVIRMEAIYDLEFSDKKRYKTSIVKNITNDSITITSTYNEKCAQYEGRKFELITYPINAITLVRFIEDRSLGLFSRKNIDKNFDLVVKAVDKAKLCPAVLTFRQRNNEVKICHYYLTGQGYDILYETNGILDYMNYPTEGQF
jgi:hypothetical protein